MMYRCGVSSCVRTPKLSSDVGDAIPAVSESKRVEQSREEIRDPYRVMLYCSEAVGTPRNVGSKKS